MLKERFKELEEKTLLAIKTFYGDRLVSVVIFGSVARETQNFHSDIDLLIIAHGLPDGRIKRVREFEAVEEKIGPLLKTLQGVGIDTGLSPILKTPAEAERGSPLFLDMVEDAKVLFDRGRFFSGILVKLRDRLKALGAKRVWRGNAWHWVLKPDFRPGEVFEL